MGPKLKKSAKNAYSLFIQDYIRSQREVGRHVLFNIAAEECETLWTALPEEEKETYRKMAAANKVFSKNEKENKFTNFGVSYAELEKQQQKLRVKIKNSDDEIKSTISSLDYDSVRNYLFYIIHCNYYCKTDEGFYLPGEIAIAEFNLKDGIRRTYHTLINPGNIPLGYAYDAKKMIEDVHGLPYPPYDEGDSDYFAILDKILNFLKPGKLASGKYPPLYTIEDNIKGSENILQSLSDNKTEGKSYFRVYYLHKMFFWLKNKCVELCNEENIGFPVMSNAESEVRKDIFCYAPGISCVFHDMSDYKYHSCSLSVVQRFVYLVCDHCCQYVNVKLIPEKHCQKNCDTTGNLAERKAERLSQKSRSSPPVEITETDFDGRSSYCGYTSILDWKTEGAASFLHDELESSFSGLEVSSTYSGLSHHTLNFTPKVRDQPKGIKKEESDDEDYYIGSIGRGTNRR